MTPEEIQKTIEQMLSIQRELQEKQIKNTELIAQNAKDINELKELVVIILQDSKEFRKELRTEINRLIGYSLSAEADKITLNEKYKFLEKRIDRLEDKIN